MIGKVCALEPATEYRTSGRAEQDVEQAQSVPRLIRILVELCNGYMNRSLTTSGDNNPQAHWMKLVVLCVPYFRYKKVKRW